MSDFVNLLQKLLSTLGPGQAPPAPTPPPAQSPLFGTMTGPRQNPDDMFTPEQNFARYQQFAKPGPYTTPLSPNEENEFQQWLTTQPHFQQYLTTNPAYDMRGFWKAMKAGNPLAVTSVDPNDKMVHHPDIWKTPYQATFSNESMYALPNAPQWRELPGGWQYVTPNGQVIFDSREGRWYGMPQIGKTK